MSSLWSHILGWLAFACVGFSIVGAILYAVFAGNREEDEVDE